MVDQGRQVAPRQTEGKQRGKIPSAPSTSHTVPSEETCLQLPIFEPAVAARVARFAVSYRQTRLETGRAEQARLY